MRARCTVLDMALELGVGFGFNLQGMLERLAKSSSPVALRHREHCQWSGCPGSKQGLEHTRCSSKRRCGEKLEMLGSWGANQGVSMTRSRAHPYNNLPKRPAPRNFSRQTFPNPDPLFAGHRPFIPASDAHRAAIFSPGRRFDDGTSSGCDCSSEEIYSSSRLLSFLFASERA